ncbi:transposase [Candidatus Magnetaquiglobus chichijimensis]|uniref:transposase n=1 Tax=Candidatus Magnetaquiglobus chichijimensis TaxID=3141448 RepID=UPI003B9772FE
MDLSRFKARYQVGGVGAPAMSPGMMLAVLIYGYSHGYTSSRKLERLCVRDAGFPKGCRPERRWSANF